MRTNLKLTVGLRYDRQKFEQPQVRNPDTQLAAAGIDTSFLNIDDDNFGPRLGLAWTPGPRWVVRGGYGLFFGRTPSIMVGTAHSNNGINVQTVTFTGSQAPRYPFIFPSLGKVEDTVPDATAVVPNGSDDAKFPSNPFDFDADRAPGNNDQRHRLVVSGLWDLDYQPDATGLRRALLGGWTTSWIATWQTGQPYSKTVANDLNRDGNTRNDIVPGSRNSQRLPDTYNVDLRLAKRIPITGSADLELIAEAFNLFDRDNVNLQRNVFYNFTGGALVPQTNFGADIGAADNRIVQLAAKITF